MVCDPGGSGGAPTLDVNRVRLDIFNSKPQNGGGLGGTGKDSGLGHQIGSEEGRSQSAELDPERTDHNEGQVSQAEEGDCFIEDMAAYSTIGQHEAAGMSPELDAIPSERRGSKRLAEDEASSGDLSTDEGGESHLILRVGDGQEGGEACVASLKGEGCNGSAASAASLEVLSTTQSQLHRQPNTTPPSSPSPLSMALPVELDTPTCHGEENSELLTDIGSSHDSSAGLLLLIPLTLGVGKINPLYLPQLQRVLTFRQSVGIVGGRPGASLLFVGYQVSNLCSLQLAELEG